MIDDQRTRCDAARIASGTQPLKEELHEDASHRRAGRDLGRLQLPFTASSGHGIMRGCERVHLFRQDGCQSAD
jgi:hypothetical protein